MEPARVVLGHHVEQERIRVVVQRLVVEKQLRQQAEVLSVAFVFPPVNLEKADCALAIDLVPGRMAQVALFRVPLQTLATLPVLETELADVDTRHRAHLLRVGRKVPRFDPVPAELDQLHVLHARHHIVVVRHHTARLARRRRRGYVLRVLVFGGGRFPLSADFLLQCRLEHGTTVDRDFGRLDGTGRPGAGQRGR